MTILDDLRLALKKQGAVYVLKRTPWYLDQKLGRTLESAFGRMYNPYGTISREEMKGACVRAGNIWYYGSPTTVEVTSPVNEPPTDQMQEHMGVYEVPQSFVCELQNIRLVGSRALARTLDGRYVVEEFGTDPIFKRRLLEMFGSLPPREKFRKRKAPSKWKAETTDYDTLINLVPRHGEEHNNYINFGHWLLEDLPRLRAYDHYENETGRKPKILLKKDPPSWMVETIELLGFTSSDWIVRDGGSASVSRLVVPKLSAVHSWDPQFQPSDRRWVSEQMKSQIDLNAGRPFSNRVFVSRQGQSRRYVENFDEVMSRISALGFEAVRPEELSIEDQIRLFDQADIIAGVTGSAFANIVFACDAILVQIVPDGTEIPPWYVYTAEQGLDYDYMFAEPVGPKAPNKNSNIRIHAGNLTEKLRVVIERQVS